MPNPIIHVVAVYSNPFGFANRKLAFQQFLAHMKNMSNIRLHIVEVAYPNNNFEFTKWYNLDHIQLRSKCLIWIKESAINVAVSRLPKNWEYAAYIDADFIFSNQNWAAETISSLQKHPWIQLFSGYSFLTPDHRPVWNRPGFAYVYQNYANSNVQNLLSITANRGSASDAPYTGPSIGAVGGGWAWTRSAFEQTDGLLDVCVLGSADIFMALGLVGCPYADRDEIVHCDPAYAAAIQNWTNRAHLVIQGNIGYANNHISHLWHGDIRSRGYETRWQILSKYAFNPASDLIHNSDGLIQWAGNKPELEEAVARYFMNRNEDNNTVTTQPAY